MEAEIDPQARVNLQVDHPLHLDLQRLRSARRLFHGVHDEWPIEGLDFPALDPPPLYTYRTQRQDMFVLQRGTGIAAVTSWGKQVSVIAWGSSSEKAKEVMDGIRKELPLDARSDSSVVPVTFWTWSPSGPRSLRRDLDAPRWEDIAENYAESTVPGLEALVEGFKPGAGGQLILWHGDAGTGKTTALRALARSWRDWADLHYVMDPDQLFGEHASYLMDVLMSGEGERGAKANRWRLVVLEDCGEMLQPDAKREVGQALSRLLNACDGLIGRGLRVLVLITTNEPVDKINDAVKRPGRCASRVLFEPLSPEQARAWLDARDVPDGWSDRTPRTLADLYALRDGRATDDDAARAVGFAVS